MADIKVWMKMAGLLGAGVLIWAGCETSALNNQGSVSLAQLQGQGDPTPTPDPGPNPDPNNPNPTPGGGWPAEIDGPIRWLHNNVADWAVTASLNASVSGGTINMPYTKARVWPSVGGLNANPWVIVKFEGQWYAATFEWLRYGQTSKPTGVLDGRLGDHIKVPPLNRWRPRSGERFGIMVSGLARAQSRNVRERSNVSMVTWP